MFLCCQPTGGKRSHKGRGKSFTNPEALERQRVKDEKEREWRKQRGEIDSESSEDDSEDGSGSDSSGSGNDASGSEDGIAFAKEPAEEGAAGGAKPKKGADKGAKKQQMPPRLVKVAIKSNALFIACQFDFVDICIIFTSP